MKTLYVSDLDGTLLTDGAVLSDHTLAALNQRMAKGLLFSAATGRSLPMAQRILAPLRLSLPVLLLNGAHIYDMARKKTLCREDIAPEVLEDIFPLLSHPALCRIGYVLQKDGGVHLYYDGAVSSAAQRYIALRQKSFMAEGYPDALLPRDFADTIAHEAVCFLILVSEDVAALTELAERLNRLPALCAHIYLDVSHLATVEVMSSRAGKDKGLAFLKQYCRAERVVSFGDNGNDIAMKRESDLFCAVENALPPIKEQADRVIGSNISDGVAHFIADDWKE